MLSAKKVYFNLAMAAVILDNKYLDHNKLWQKTDA